MMKEYYIIRKMPWGYGELPEYYSENGFTRDIRQVKIFENAQEASDERRKVSDVDSNCVILRM